MSSSSWEHLILDANPPTRALSSLAVGDIDGDGNVEVVTGGDAVFWYRPATCERGIVAEVQPHVGLALEDVDDDGMLEVVLGHKLALDTFDNPWDIVWFDPGPDLCQPWTRHVIDHLPADGPHDVVFADLDGDGVNELIANSMYWVRPGLFIYKPGADPTRPWRKQTVQDRLRGEGTVAADLSGNGKGEIVSGPYLYTSPPGGPFSGPWSRYHLAPGFREMCRAALVDVTGNGRPDVVLVESEYPDGRLSWFENRTLEDPAHPWVEHFLDRPWNYAHSLCAWRDEVGTHVFVAEMAKGGWDAPRNWDARLMQFTTTDQGETWQRKLIYQGAGTHEAKLCDLDGDGALEIVGEGYPDPVVQIWKQCEKPAAVTRFRHRFLDTEKHRLSTDILAADVEGNGLRDVVCAAWWYENPTWERHDIPGVYQVHNAFDIDRDGRAEFIATKKSPTAQNDYEGLTSQFCWLKPIDPVNGEWEEHAIAVGHGDWPHGTLVAPLLPGGRLALVAGYHSAGEGDRPEIFEIPDDPTHCPWPQRVLADIPYGEEFVAHDMTGNGALDVVAGRYWLENVGDGAFRPHQVNDWEDFDDVARVRVADLNGNGLSDIVVVQEDVEWGDVHRSNFAPVAWFENPGDPRQRPWKVHVIDKVRCPHSLDVVDLDDDGELEVIVGEHDPFNPYRSQCRLYIYKRSKRWGRAWYRYPIDDRFEHHDGAKVFEVAPGRWAIMSHGWRDTFYVHLWEMY